MKTTLIIYSYITFILAVLGFWYFDLPIALFFYGNVNSGVEVLFHLITESGERLYWMVPTALGYFFYRFVPLKHMPFSAWLMKNREVDMRVMGFVALSVFWSGLLVSVLKMTFARYRPVEYFTTENYGMSWLSHGYEVASFPSGHSATALSVAVALALLFPRYRYLVLIYGALVAFSRIVISEHYFSDVVIGGYIGVLVSVILYNSYFRDESVYLK